MDMDSVRSGLPQPQIERRTFPFDAGTVELRQDGDSPSGINWYAALFDQLSEDLGGFRERIGRRAFSKSLQDREVRALINHDPNLILGRSGNGSLKLGVDLRGLHAETSIPDTSYARDLIVNVRNGNISGGSFMFVATRDRWDMETVEGIEEKQMIRTVQEARLYDVSLVSFPAYPATEGSASLRSLAAEWRKKLTGEGEQRAEDMEMCAAMKAMCANCEKDCEMKAQMDMGERQSPLIVNLRRYRRRLELLKLNIVGGI